MKCVLAAALALGLAGCGTTTAPQPGPVIAHGAALREPLVSPRPYGAADTAFGLDVLGAWCRADPQANLVLSPSSLASGLGMAYLGARGATARAMDGVLHLPAANGQALEAGLQARSAALRGLDGPGVTVKAADQVGADPTLTTSPDDIVFYREQVTVPLKSLPHTGRLGRTAFEQLSAQQIPVHTRIDIRQWYRPDMM